MISLLTTIFENTAAAQHKLDLPIDKELRGSSNAFKEREISTEDAVRNVKSNDVGDDAHADNLHPPSGGLKAWLFVLAIFFMFISAWGLTQTFGAFQDIYITSLLPSTSSSAISWIGSVQCFLVIILGVLTGPLFDAGYLRPLLVVGSILIVLGMAMLSLATTYWHVFLAQALCVGFGSGLIYIPCLALVATLFPPSTRPWAIGCANSGGSIGGIVFPFMLRRLVPTIGFAWAVRAIALVNLVLAIVALTIILPHRPKIPGPRGPLLDLRAFREPGFALFALSMLFNYIAVYIPPFYIPVYATVALGQSRDFAFNSLAIMSAASLFGRTVPMLAASRTGSVQIILAGSAAAVVVMFAWMAVHNAAGFIAFCVLYGISAGMLVAAPSAAISHPVLSPSMSVIGTRMGMSWMFGGVGVLVGAPIAGTLVDLSVADFRPAQGFAGAMFAVGSLSLIVPLVAVIKYNRKNKA